MTLWNSLLNPDEVLKVKRGKPVERTVQGVTVGCDGCSLAPLKHHKFLSKQTNGANQLWLRAPSEADNTLRQVGADRGLYQVIKRLMRQRNVDIDTDFETQFAVKCLPGVFQAGKKVLLNRPRDEHYTACMQHTQNIAKLNSIARSSESVTILLGYDAGKQHSESHYKFDAPVYWHPEFKSTCYVLPYPTPDVLAGEHTDSERFYQLLDVACSHVRNPGRYSYLWSLDVRPIYTATQFRQLLAHLRSTGERVSVDIEDDGKGRLLCVGFCVDPSVAHVLVLDHPENTSWKREKDKLLQLLREFLEDSQLEKTFQFGSYDAVELEDTHNFVVRGYTFDTLYGSFLRASYNRKHGLEAIAQREFPEFAGYKTIVERYYSKADGDDTTDEESGALDRGIAGLAQCPLATLVQYNGGDVILTKKAELRFAPDINPALMQCYIRAGITLRRAESNGPELDVEHQELVHRVAERTLDEIIERLKVLTGDKEFNPGSSPQVKHYMFDVFNLPRLGEIDEDLADEDNPDVTNATALERIAYETEHEFPKLILDYRTFSKIKQYAVKLEESAGFHDGEIRTRFQLAGAATGRLRSSGEKDKVTKKTKKLNLQNITRAPFVKNMICSTKEWRRVLKWAKPLWSLLAKGPSTKSDEWKQFKKDNHAKFRKVLGKVPEWILALSILLICDLSAAEVRTLAFFARDPALLEAFRNGLDIHSAVGSEMGFGTYDEIKKNKELRARVKAAIFGMCFGLTETGLYYYVKKTVPNVTREEVADMHRRFFARFGGVARYIQSCHAEYEEQGYVDTPWGFRRWINHRVVKASLDNTSVNTRIQNAAHQFMLFSLAILNMQPRKYRLLAPQEKTGLSLEVHDAFYAKVQLRHLWEAKRQIVHLMEKASLQYSKDFFGVEFDIPMLSEPSYGFTMGTEAGFDWTDAAPPDELDLLINWLLKYWETEEADSAEYGYDRRIAA